MVLPLASVRLPAASKQATRRCSFHTRCCNAACTLRFRMLPCPFPKCCSCAPTALRACGSLLTCFCSYFHGGGWTVGSIASHDGVCQLLAFQNQISVVSVAYRLAPEHPFPAAVDDAIASCTCIMNQLRPAAAGGDHAAAAAAAAALWGVSPGAAVGVGGDSAGGTLAAAAAQHLRSSLSFQLLVYPFTDGSRANASDLTYTLHP